MEAQLKPTNEEIEGYLMTWIQSLDRDGIVITDDELIQEQLERASSVNWGGLRKMFAPEMYNSIREYVDKTKA